MEGFLCIHGHFYQPPRENPWLEAVEIQDSAYPYHDWNERITAECYAPNYAARNLDGEGRILHIVSNYSRISFDFGPTLLSWMETNTPEVYRAILEADQRSQELRSGHGNAIAQAYNHIILPLANSRDKRTQIKWGIRDFESRFKRKPEGMWLPETAVDYETLEILAEQGIIFTILAPRQAAKIRTIGSEVWEDVSGSRIDPTRVYRCRLPSGNSINIFFYDGPISQAVAFEELLKEGTVFADRLLSGFSDSRPWTQILHIATDGETYGHHQKYGDMALAYALHFIESEKLVRITNYGEFLEKHPPTHEVQIFEDSSWSCIHGIERWRSDCGCNSGMHAEWNQKWREPLREAFDWLNGELIPIYEKTATAYLKDPWGTRDEYINVILNRSEGSIEQFFHHHAIRPLNSDERSTVLNLLEMQRHTMLMYTSCGWFFDELSGLETIQVLQYAGRALQLAETLLPDNLEDKLKSRLSMAKSNIHEFGNGAQIYERFVKPAMINLKKVGVHFAVSSLFEEYIEETIICSYKVKKEDFQILHAGSIKLAIGRVNVLSKITGDSERLSFCVLHFGGHALNGGIRTFKGYGHYESMKQEISETFERGDFADIVRLMDHHFGMHSYSLENLFRDEQRNIIDTLIAQTVEEFNTAYRQMYENNKVLMSFLLHTGMPIRKAFYAAAEFTLNYDIKKAFHDEDFDVDKIQYFIDEIKKWKIAMDSVDLEFAIRHKLEKLMEELLKTPEDYHLLLKVQKLIELVAFLPIEVHNWMAQNIYYKLAKTEYRKVLKEAHEGNNESKAWIATFKYIGEMLFFNIGSVLPNE